tara:strand:- start:3638 stop:5149 length:1512 start_codon:yes stop_codon:yes gene_type:complete
MAVKFLDNLDLNDNQLLNARLENLSSDPGSANAGDIIYNTTSNVFKYYNGSSWVDPSTGSYTGWTVQADSGSTYNVSSGTTVDFSGGTGISTSASSPSPTGTVTITNSKPFDSITLAASSGSNSTISNSGTITLAAGTGITTTNNGSGQVTIAATGSGSMSSFDVSADSGTDFTVSDGDVLSLSKATNGGIATAIGASEDQVTFSMDINDLATASSWDNSADYIAVDDGGTSKKILSTSIRLGDFSNNMGSQKITNVTDPTSAQDAATKAYVDSVITGQLVFQGGYDASADPPTGASVLQGYTYVVTVAGSGTGGSFWSTPLEIGDLIIADQDNPVDEDDWTEVNKNIDVASATTVGVASFPTAGGLSITAAGAVSMADTGTSGSKGSASQVPVFTTDAKGRVTANTNTTISITSSNVSNFNTATDSRIVAKEFAGLNEASGTSHTITHDLGTRDVMVDIYDASTYETVYAKVVRTSTSVVTVTTSASIAAESIMVLVKSIDD